MTKACLFWPGVVVQSQCPKIACLGWRLLTDEAYKLLEDLLKGPAKMPSHLAMKPRRLCPPTSIIILLTKSHRPFTNTALATIATYHSHGVTQVSLHHHKTSRQWLHTQDQSKKTLPPSSSSHTLNPPRTIWTSTSLCSSSARDCRRRTTRYTHRATEPTLILPLPRRPRLQNAASTEALPLWSRTILHHWPPRNLSLPRSSTPRLGWRPPFF